VLSILGTRGVALFAISYDSIPILRAFATEHGISFPLLSDEGSHVIRRLGLLNERVQEDHAVYGIQPNPRHVGVPYPGVFVLDERGVVIRKRFHDSYRERDTGPGLVAHALDLLEAAPIAGAPSSGDPVGIRAWLDSRTYAWFQRLLLTIEVVTTPGVGVFGHCAPPGFVPLTVSVEPIEGLEVGPTTWSPPQHRVKGLHEKFGVHEGTIRGSLPLTFTAPPGHGDQVVQVRVAYQARSEANAFPASSIRLDLPVQERPLIGRVLPSEGKT
jgi:AhpC/TSA family